MFINLYYDSSIRGDSHIFQRVGRIVVSFMGKNQGPGIFQGVLKVFGSPTDDLVSFRVSMYSMFKSNLTLRAWYLLGAFLKISEDHPYPKYEGVNSPPTSHRSCSRVVKT